MSAAGKTSKKSTDSRQRSKLTRSCKASVSQWLTGLRFVTENECMSILQGKSLAHDHSDIIVTPTHNVNVTYQITQLHRAYTVLKMNIGNVFLSVDGEKWQQASDETEDLVVKIESLVALCPTFNSSADDDDVTPLADLRRDCVKLTDYIRSRKGQGQTERNGYRRHQTELLQSISRLVDQIVYENMTSCIQTLIDGLDVSSDQLGDTLRQLVAVGLQADYISSIIVKLNGVERLIELCFAALTQSPLNNVSVISSPCISVTSSNFTSMTSSLLSTSMTSSSHCTPVTSSPLQSNHTLSTPTQCIQSLLNLSPSIFGSKSEEIIEDCAPMLRYSDAAKVLSADISSSSRRFSNHLQEDSPGCSRSDRAPLSVHESSFIRESPATARVSVGHNCLDATVLSQALHALATICSVPESLRRLDEAGGIACLSDILRASALSHEVRCEAAGVVAQITAPSLADCQPIHSFMEHSVDIVQSLIELCRDCVSQQVFLISSAALANITSIDSITSDYLIQFGALTDLMHACSDNRAQSVFARDQVATIIANIASIESCSPQMISNPDVGRWIVAFLHESVDQLRESPANKISPAVQPTNGHSNEDNIHTANQKNTEQEDLTRIADTFNGLTAVELAACERVQQKAALTIDRLCRDRDIALHFINLKCVSRLVELCNRPETRNHSDLVLAACLAALRKLYNVCGPTHHALLRSNSVYSLINSDVMQSFLQHSTATESFI